MTYMYIKNTIEIKNNYGDYHTFVFYKFGE